MVVVIVIVVVVVVIQQSCVNVCKLSNPDDNGIISDCLSLADISFLLPFLRVRYFSQLEARKLLDNFMTRRSKFPHWFRNLDPGDPKLQEIYDRKFVHCHSRSLTYLIFLPGIV